MSKPSNFAQRLAETVQTINKARAINNSKVLYWRKYSCSGCGGPVVKTPLRAVPRYDIAELKEFKGLGTWKCVQGCKSCKVKVELEKVVDTRKRKAAKA